MMTLSALELTTRGEIAVHVSDEQVTAGQAVYSKRVLRVYDFVVLGVSNRFIWKCPTQRLDSTTTSTLLPIIWMSVSVPATSLIAAACLAVTAHRVDGPEPERAGVCLSRLARYKPETYRRNVLEPISIDAARFDSVGINYLLHCVPGPIESKAVALDHLKILMNPNAVLFGSTLLQGGVTRNWLATRLMDTYNTKGIFSNRYDDLDGLKRALGQRLREVSVEVVGCAALFSGRV